MCALLRLVLVTGSAASVSPQGNAADDLPDLTEEEEAIFPNPELLQASLAKSSVQIPLVVI